jgi:gliding motility-associated-like protein
LGDTLNYLDSLIVDTGDYVFSLTSIRGCDSTVVLHVERQEIVLSVSSQHVCPGEEVILSVLGVHTFHWVSLPSDPSLESQQGRNTVAVHPMEYTVYQVLGPEGELLAAVDVEMESCEGLWFPNVFTPDAETNNRFVILTSLPVESFEMTVYSRDGLMVWHSEDINQMWDGTRNGTPMPQGAYVYHWRLKSNNRVRSGLGTITLLR